MPLAALLVVGLALAACTDGAAESTVAGSPAPSTTPTSSTTVAVGVATTTAAPVAPTTTAEPEAAPAKVPVSEVLVIGDSIGRQLAYAAEVLLADSGPPSRYLISAGPGYYGASWPNVLATFAPDQRVRLVVVSFGIWQAAPPEGAAPDVTEQITDQISTYLGAVAAWAGPDARLVFALVPDNDDPVVNDALTRVNPIIVGEAERLGFTVDVLPSTTDAATVEVGGVAYRLRSPDDATHYCPVPMLAIGHDLLNGRVTDAPARPTAELAERLLADPLRAEAFPTSGCGAG